MSVNTIVGSEPDGVIVAEFIITILDRDPALRPLAQS